MESEFTVLVGPEITTVVLGPFIDYVECISSSTSRVLELHWPCSTWETAAGILVPASPNI